MITHPAPTPAQHGYMLLEALVSMMIFSIGVLGVLAIVAVAVKNNSSAKYRTDASLVANELIGQMWADNRTPATLLANYQGGGGTDGDKYTVWLNDIINNNRLPGVSTTDNKPTVTVTTIDGAYPPTSSKSQVVVTVFWQLPGESQHSYVAMTEIK